MIPSKTKFVVLVIFILFLACIWFLSRTPTKPTTSHKIQIVTTIFPLYDFAKNIGQDKVEVSLLIPRGVEVHHFEPKPSDILKIQRSDIFVYTGTSMEPWVKDIVSAIAQSKVRVVDASVGVTLIQNTPQGSDDSEKSADPHIWLDFKNAKSMVKNITQVLTEIDRQNAKYYRNNSAVYQDKLTEIDSEYKEHLSTCQSKTIVYGGHYAFGYLAKRYGLVYVSAQGFSPDSEPTAQDLIRLIREIKDHNIHYVFYEELTSPKTAETLARETGAKLLLLNAAHNISKIDSTNTISFVSIMKQNLENLQVGLRCKK